jgi:heterodisulfide reductase subunit A-like polyferredoxin
MAETSYDGIIIGAGQHGLVLACYLAKAGLKIALVERRMQYGGGLMTEEVTAPGYMHNLHSINHWDLKGTPWSQTSSCQLACRTSRRLRVLSTACGRNRTRLRSQPRGDGGLDRPLLGRDAETSGSGTPRPN